MVDHPHAPLDALVELQSMIVRKIRAVPPEDLERVALTLGVDLTRTPIEIRSPAMVMGLMALVVEPRIYDAAAQIRQIAMLEERARSCQSTADEADRSVVLGGLVLLDPGVAEVARVCSAILTGAFHPEVELALAAIAAACEYDWLWRAVVMQRRFRQQISRQIESGDER